MFGFGYELKEVNLLVGIVYFGCLGFLMYILRFLNIVFFVIFGWFLYIFWLDVCVVELMFEEEGLLFFLIDFWLFCWFCINVLFLMELCCFWLMNDLVIFDCLL